MSVLAWVAESWGHVLIVAWGLLLVVVLAVLWVSERGQDR